MLNARLIVSMVSAGMMVLGAGVVSGQAYPNKSIRVVASPAGGGGDVVTRLIAQGISRPLGQSVIIDNRASGVMSEIVAKAPADGYTMLVSGGPLWITPLLQKAQYDPVKDFSPISLVSKTPLILVVHPLVPVNSVNELIALAKARQEQLNYAAGSTGAVQHLAAELFKAMAGVNLVNIPYKGAAPALNALIGGEVQVAFANPPAAMSFVKSGRLRAIAVASAEPSELAPGLPTVAASGLLGYEAASTLGIFAPAKTPATIINRLNQEIVRFLQLAETKEKFLNAGAEPIGSTPEQLAATVKSEMSRLGKVIKEAGIRAD